MRPDGLILALDTGTSVAVVALGEPGGRLISASSWRAGQRHSEELLPRIEQLLRDADVRPADLIGIIVGTGPGAFTGLRVGLATAKTLAHELGLPIAGVSTSEALLAAAAADADVAGDAGELYGGQAPAPAGGRPVLLLPAGSTDRVLARAGQAPTLLPGGRDPQLASDEWMVAIDLDGRAPAAAVALGEHAQAGLAGALLGMGAARLAAGDSDEVARLVPEYVTLPRGVAASSGEIEWSRDHR